MIYQLPNGHISASTLDFSQAINIPKNPSHQKGMMIPVKNSNPVLGFRCKQWGSGTERKTPKVKKFKADIRFFKL